MNSNQQQLIQQLAYELDVAKNEIIKLKFEHELKTTDKNMIVSDFKVSKNPFMCFKTKITANWANDVTYRFGYQALINFLHNLIDEQEKEREEKKDE